MDASLRVENLAATQRALRRADKAASTRLNAELKGMAQETADRARQLAPRRSGKLAASIRPYARRGEVGVRASAQNQGYNYAGRIEYDRTSGRPFLRPAVAETVEDANRVLDQIGDAIERAFR